MGEDRRSGEPVEHRVHENRSYGPG
jgi:hypothetical protein